MRNVLRYLALVSVLFTTGACSALNTPGTDEGQRTYAAAMQLVIPAAAEACAETGLEVEQQFWQNPDTYVLAGHRRSSVVRSRGEGVQVAAVKVYIHRLDDTQTQVRVETSRDDPPAAASSADRRYDEARRFFARLDAKFE